MRERMGSAVRLGLFALAILFAALGAHRCGTLLGERVVISSSTPGALGR
jgi:hypothetical protein